MNRSNEIAAKPILTTREMTATALMTALICALGPIAFPIPVLSPVPISLGTLAIYLAVYVLGMKKGILSVVVYLLLGLVGLPVFTGFSGGPAKVIGPTGGYMIGYLFLAAIEGFFTDHFHGKQLMTAIGMVTGTALLYLFGTLWLAFQMNLTFGAALGAGVLPYLPGDTVKIILALILGSAIRRRFPDHIY